MNTNATLFVILSFLTSTNSLPTNSVVLPHKALVNWSTNLWVQVPGYRTITPGTDSVMEALYVVSRQRIQVINVVTTYEDFQLEKMVTNGMTRWNHRPVPPPLPGTPGRQ